jgi:hypothetical protein
VLSILLLGLAGCQWLTGLEELDTVPPDVPIAVDASRVGIVTRSATGQVSFDLAHAKPEMAEAAFEELEQQAVAKGFERKKKLKMKKREVHVMEGPGGRLELSCCPQRADRQQLVLVAWFPE